MALLTNSTLQAVAMQLDRKNEILENFIDEYIPASSEVSRPKLVNEIADLKRAYRKYA